MIRKTVIAALIALTGVNAMSATVYYKRSGKPYVISGYSTSSMYVNIWGNNTNTGVAFNNTTGTCTGCDVREQTTGGSVATGTFASSAGLGSSVGSSPQGANAATNSSMKIDIFQPALAATVLTYPKFSTPTLYFSDSTLNTNKTTYSTVNSNSTGAFARSNITFTGYTPTASAITTTPGGQALSSTTSATQIASGILTYEGAVAFQTAVATALTTAAQSEINGPIAGMLSFTNTQIGLYNAQAASSRQHADLASAKTASTYATYAMNGLASLTAEVATTKADFFDTVKNMRAGAITNVTTGASVVGSVTRSTVSGGTSVGYWNTAMTTAGIGLSGLYTSAAAANADSHTLNGVQGTAVFAGYFKAGTTTPATNAGDAVPMWIVDYSKGTAGTTSQSVGNIANAGLIFYTGGTGAVSSNGTVTIPPSP